MDTEIRIAGHGSVHAMGIWLASVEYSLLRHTPEAVEAKIYVLNGERDLSPDSIFAEEMVLELEDGRWGRMVTLGGSASIGAFRVRLVDGLAAPADRARLAGDHWRLS